MSAWYDTTFTQLPDVAQKQVGALVGSLVADAAVNGLDLDEIMDESAADTLPLFQHLPAVSSFAPRNGGKGLCSSLPLEDSPISLVDPSFYRVWSPAAVAAVDILDTIDAIKTVDGSAWFHAVAVAVERALNSMPREYSSSLAPASLSLFPVCAGVPIATLYPWAKDTDMFANFGTVLTAVSNRDDEIRGAPAAAGRQQLRPLVCPVLAAAESDAESADQSKRTIEHYLAACSVLLRSVQSNPDAVGNALLKLRAPNVAGGGGAAFSLPKEVPAFSFASPGADASAALPKWGTSNDVLLSAWSIVRSHRHLLVRSGSSAVAERRGTLYEPQRAKAGAGAGAAPSDFERVIRCCLRETIRRKPMLGTGASGAVATGLASYVGACVGAHIGVRQIPTEFIAATDVDGALGRAVNSAVSVSQWIWNAPS